MKAMKKPIAVDVIEFTGNNNQEVLDFTGGAAFFDSKFGGAVQTLEGTMHFEPGDFIIRGVRGEYHPVGRGIFLESYNILEG